MKQSRWQSKAMWLAILAQVVIVLQLTGVVTISEVELINGVATAIVQILVLFGVLNSPTTKNGL